MDENNTPTVQRKKEKTDHEEWEKNIETATTLKNVSWAILIQVICMPRTMLWLISKHDVDD